ncbi:LPS assembly protein LptD [Oleiagrimonas soli]|uniref:LPS-assembly protein LptD n=1 Tax=Oleiagrimonas soli TaxID=1543381 RepID=A0A099CTY1_9GAMM|nr:LPS assembly protein LptD [Oleiagrimonas soli]KGI77047.1 organic solvent tolerance protein [Oleiagrimonas soli]MBB6185428.1 LPS-assembly protein [Oleiagrimonas soli]
MSTRQPAPPRRRLLALAVALAVSGTAAHAAQDATTTVAPIPAVRGAKAPPAPCPLGSLFCPPRPVSYALCRPNALLAFYQPGLPQDTDGRDLADTDVRAAHVDSSNRSVYRLDGQVRLQRYDQLLRADHVDYNDVTTAYDAHGDVRYQDSTMLLSAQHIQGTTMPDRSTANTVQYQLLESHGNGIAGTAQLFDPQHSKLQQATYSTCDPGDRVWEFRAKQIDLNKQTGVGVAHHATLRYHHVPILYLPYMSFPIDNRRKSGFLYPTFGNSSNAGFTYSQPYYLNLAPNYDATLTPNLYSERGLMLGTQFRYLTDLGRGVLNVDYLPNDSKAGSDHSGNTRPDLKDGANRYFIDFSNVTPIGRQWNFSVRYRHVSDPYYFKDFSNDIVRSATTVLPSNAYISGHGNWWNAAIGVDRYESVDPALPDNRLQYRRWPRGVFNMDIPLSRYIDFGLNTEAVAFRRDESVQGNRLDLQPYVSWSLGGSAWYVKPRVAYRYTRYDLIGDFNQYAGSYTYPNRTPSRSMPIYSVDSGLYFERQTSLFGEEYTQTLEPRLYYLYVPYRNQDDLPLFDTRLMTFDYWQLFSTNRFSGADRQMDANNLTGAITSRLLDANGDERASISFGQIRYLQPQRVQLTPNAPEIDYSGSAYVSQFSLKLSDDWRLNSAYQWSPNTRHNQVATLGVQRRIGADGVFNFSYRYRNRFLEQLDASAVYPISARWRVLGRWNVSLRDSLVGNPNWNRGHPKTLDAVAGVEYDSCCVAIRLVGHHYVRDNYGNTNNAVMLEIEFKGLGSTTPQTESFLQRAILGYQ